MCTMGVEESEFSDIIWDGQRLDTLRRLPPRKKQVLSRKTDYVVKTACPDCREVQYVFAGQDAECAFCGSRRLGRDGLRCGPLAVVPVQLTLNQLTGQVFALAPVHTPG